jgi:hypothetical protein
VNVNYFRLVNASQGSHRLLCSFWSCVVFAKISLGVYENAYS